MYLAERVVFESVCVPCDLRLAPEAEIKSLGRRVNWMFTHKHTHGRSSWQLSGSSSQQGEERKGVLAFRR